MRTTPFIVSLCMLVFLAACKSELYSGLSEREANKIVAELLEAGIPASKSRSEDSFTIMADKNRFAQAISLLESKGLPRQTYANLGDIFKKEGLVSSPTEDRARMIYALSEELSSTITLIDGVLSARIHVVLPETDMLGRDVKPSSAAVFIVYSPTSNVQSYSAQIKLLVANSIEGLLYDNISLVMVLAETNSKQNDQVKFANILGVSVLSTSINRFWAIIGGFAAVITISGWFYLRKLYQMKSTIVELTGSSAGM